MLDFVGGAAGTWDRTDGLKPAGLMSFSSNSDAYHAGWNDSTAHELSSTAHELSTEIDINLDLRAELRHVNAKLELESRRADQAEWMWERAENAVHDMAEAAHVLRGPGVPLEPYTCHEYSPREEYQCYLDKVVTQHELAMHSKGQQQHAPE